MILVVNTSLEPMEQRVMVGGPGQDMEVYKQQIVYVVCRPP